MLGSTTSGQVVLGCTRKWTEPATRSKPVSRGPPWLHAQLQVPDLSFNLGFLQRCTVTCESNKLFAPQLLSVIEFSHSNRILTQTGP